MTSTTGRSTKLRQASPRGFTLLELVLVLLLTSMILALSVPQLSGFLKGRRGADASAQILALANYARTQAVGSGSVYRLNLDEQTQTYWLSVQRGVEFYELGSEFGRHFTLPQEIKAAWDPAQGGTANWIDFHPDGRVAAVALNLTDLNGRKTVIGCRSETEPLVILPETQL